ncbi:type VII secretion target [Nocardioides dongkuii]|uniref:type VII secretion target n=1 Tax=Nocardioides dongkuii TaxID=2760089 RepID=UPI0015FBF417|nr:type VII secretion target [Nocardioides dongkuii]
MTFEVLVEELRSAAGKHRAVAGDLGTEPVEMKDEKSTEVGHVELAGWMNAVGDQCVKAHDALHSGLETLASRLDLAADDYRRTDEQTAAGFRSPLLPPGPGGAR